MINRDAPAASPSTSTPGVTRRPANWPPPHPRVEPPQVAHHELESYERFREGLFADLVPGNQVEFDLVEDVVSARWRLRTIREAVFAETAKPPDPTVNFREREAWYLAELKRGSVRRKEEARLNKLFLRAMADLRRSRKHRGGFDLLREQRLWAERMRLDLPRRTIETGAAHRQTPAFAAASPSFAPQSTNTRLPERLERTYLVGSVGFEAMHVFRETQTERPTQGEPAQIQAISTSDMITTCILSSDVICADASAAESVCASDREAAAGAHAGG